MRGLLDRLVTPLGGAVLARDQARAMDAAEVAEHERVVRLVSSPGSSLSPRSGSSAALAEFRRQGHGVLINVSSMIGGLAGPQATAYAASKWGLRGFTLALHEELHPAPGIAVCVVRPTSFDTPIFRHAANYSGRALKALTPTYSVHEAAAAIADLIEHPRREVILGSSGKKVAAAHAVLPAVVDRIFAKRTLRDQFDDRPAADTPGNAFEPDPGWKSESGDWPVQKSRRAAVLVPLLAGVAAAAVRRRS